MSINEYGLIKYKVDLFCYLGRIKQQFYQVITCSKRLLVLLYQLSEVV